MKLKVVSRKAYDYVRYDLKEIAFPSSLPDPPHIKKRRKLTWKERYLVCSIIRYIFRLNSCSGIGSISCSDFIFGIAFIAFYDGPKNHNQ